LKNETKGFWTLKSSKNLRIVGKADTGRYFKLKKTEAEEFNTKRKSTLVADREPPKDLGIGAVNEN
jgi:hypothetical protein